MKKALAAGGCALSGPENRATDLIHHLSEPFWLSDDNHLHVGMAEVEIQPIFQLENLLINLSTIGCSSLFFSLLSDNSIPKYLHGNDRRGQTRICSSGGRLTCSHRTGIRLLLQKLGCSPEASPNSFRTWEAALRS